MNKDRERLEEGDRIRAMSEMNRDRLVCVRIYKELDIGYIYIYIYIYMYVHINIDR